MENSDWGEIAFNDIELSTTFYQDGLEYQAQLTSAGAFSFHLVGGNSKKGSVWHSKRDRYNLFMDEPVYADVDLTVNAIPVFRKAGDILLSWIYSKKIPRIAFAASTTRKIKIYRWLATRLGRLLSDSYTSIEYPQGKWNFYRLN